MAAVGLSCYGIVLPTGAHHGPSGLFILASCILWVWANVEGAGVPVTEAHGGLSVSWTPPSSAACPGLPAPALGKRRSVHRDTRSVLWKVRELRHAGRSLVTQTSLKLRVSL